MIDVGQYSEYALDSEYARVLNMLGLHMVLNKILHRKYLAGSEYPSYSEYSEYTCLTGF